MPEDTPSLTADETRVLRLVAGMMIPASSRHGVPGADDDAIFADIVRSVGRDAALVKAAVARLNALAGGSFADKDAAGRNAAAARFRENSGPEVAALNRVISQCYYRDDRVVQSLGLELRPPFPKGFEVEQGDWSLLDPVRAKPKLWRDAG